ncbi:MAG TPA: SH3 domain-containing protein, partial [Polyangia bacterium]|nr:SH3 domain-containing protein [Polyangia bacterium]
WSAAALTDRGDAYAKAGSVGHAIVAYERAELLAPRDQTIVAHLNAAQAAAGLAPSPPAVYRRAAQLLSPREWSWVGLAAVWLLCLAVGAALVRPRWRRAAQRTAAAALVAGGLALAALVMIGPRSGAAIVVARGGTSLLVSPVAGAAADASVGEGAPVDVTARHEGFVRVRDGAGHEGWTSDQSVEPILPRRS